MDLLNKYSHKLVTLEKLINIIGKSPRKRKTILCHGVFDVVHPGHVRHLHYAKTQADILVVSCTSDKFIDKGIYRPHIPENMRASNLAAFEMVDYVLIDNNKRPLKLLKKLKPDLFAKGFEYNAKLYWHYQAHHSCRDPGNVTLFSFGCAFRKRYVAQTKQVHTHTHTIAKLREGGVKDY